MQSKHNVLIISSANPLVGPGYLATDLLNAFAQESYSVDLLTLNKIKGHPEYMYVQDQDSTIYKIKDFVKRNKERIVGKICRVRGKKIYPVGSYSFFYKDEQNPPVAKHKVLSKIEKQYDLVILLFWQRMLSFDTVWEIYKKLKSPIYFYSVDYSPMAGGCHFTGDCGRYKIGCGCCPAFESKDPKDFTHRNVIYRERFYKEVRPIVSGNTYMHSFFKESYLLKNTFNTLSFPIINTEKFSPQNTKLTREKYNIPSNSTFLILFGSQNVADERKGVKYMIHALNEFSKSLTDEQRLSVLLIVIGRDFSQIRPLIDSRLASLELGYVSMDALPSVYSMSDIFLCSSVNDAGPMMVNQSLCCGTPVVGFDMGTCIDSVKGQGTGYCARLRDSEDFAVGIKTIFDLSESEKEQMSIRCRQLGVDTYSYKATVNRIMRQYAEYQAGK